MRTTREFFGNRFILYTISTIFNSENLSWCKAVDKMGPYLCIVVTFSCLVNSATLMALVIYKTQGKVKAIKPHMGDIEAYQLSGQGRPCKYQAKSKRASMRITDL